MRNAVGVSCLLAAVIFGCPLAAAEQRSEREILPIQFAELIDRQNDTIEVLEIPSVVVQDEAVAGATIVPMEEVPAGRVVGERVVEPSVIGVSSRAADGLRIEDFSLDEMPYEASSGTWFSNGRWYGSAEMVWFDRSRNYRRVLGRDVTTAVPGENLVGTLTTTGIPWNIAPGARITLGEYFGRDYLDRDQALETTYYGGLAFFQRDGWNALPGSFLVTPLSPFSPPGFSGAQFYGTTHNSVFNSMEWNYKLHRRLGRDQLVMSPNGNWSRHAERAWLPAFIVGTRLANVNESFTLTSGRNDATPSQFSGLYAIDTQNWLWGLNVGGELISQNEFYFWGLRGRACPAMSFSGGQQTVSSVNNLTTFPGTTTPFPFRTGSISRASSNQQLNAGFIGDLSLFAGWNVTPNFAIKAGYDFLWVAGIATATRQFDLDNVRNKPLDGGGQVFYNGLSVGCEGSW
jgi:hypothetical protein